MTRVLADWYWGFEWDGGYDHRWDRFLAIAGLEQRPTRKLAFYLDA